ncbi:MAG TPA: YhcN/YlaJ family sporulation lipoprotein [Bacillales bacterium]|nr:YhcN/YlaJ family sporulation lipoprotein [Bacillales bacterium]
MKLKRIVLPLVLLVFSTGCLAQRPEEKGRSDRQHHPNYSEVKQSVHESHDNPRKNLTSGEIAKHLVGIAEGVPEVKNATAIVTMGYAIVGIDIDKDVDRSKVGTIKYSVAEALRNDRYGATAVVVSDPDTVQRLRNMGQSIQDGRPVSGIFNQLAEIVGRVMPQVPQDLQSPKGTQPSDQPEQKRQMPSEDRQQWEKQQKKGSKPGNNKKSPRTDDQNRNPERQQNR